MEAAPNLRLVGDDAASSFPWPETGEILSIADAHYRIRDLQDERDGLLKLTAKQARENAALARRVAEDADPSTHPQGAEIVALIERWRTYCNHRNAKMSADRVKLIRARLHDGYTPEQIALAIDGLAAAPYVVNAQRRSEGKDSQRYDQLKHALNGGQDLERFANLGHRARKQGAVTWPEYDSQANENAPAAQQRPGAGHQERA